MNKEHKTLINLLASWHVRRVLTVHPFWNNKQRVNGGLQPIKVWHECAVRVTCIRKH